MSTNRACSDPVRGYLYDHLTSYFLREDTFVLGTCETCGATGIEVRGTKPGDVGKCRAQLALTQKRNTSKEGHPVAFGSPLDGRDRGNFSMTDTNAVILVSDESATFVGKVVPSLPTPAYVTIAPELNLGLLLDRLLSATPDRFVLGAFNKKSDMPMRFSNSNEIVINGKQTPTRLNRSRLVEVVALIEEFGVDAVKKAREFREIKDFDPSKAAAIRKKLPAGLTDRIRTVPVGDEPEFEYACIIINSRAAAAA